VYFSYSRGFYKSYPHRNSKGYLLIRASLSHGTRKFYLNIATLWRRFMLLELSGATSDKYQLFVSQRQC